MRRPLCLALVGRALGAQAVRGDSIPLPEHPRPDFQRAEWLNLNGRWQFALDARDEGVGAGWSNGALPQGRTIVVPFSWGAPLSGVPDSADIGWYARKLGLQTNSLTAVEVVLADGTQVRADADTEQELFWALRGGNGNFGVVTGLEFTLYPITTAYAGHLVWDWTESEKVLRRWADWAPGAPDEITSAFRILRMPALPQVPEFVRDRPPEQRVHIDSRLLCHPGHAVDVDRCQHAGPRM